MSTRCPYCGWPDTDPFTVLSRHPTPNGTTVWTRCGCGSLQVRLDDGICSRVLTRGRPAARS